MARKSISKSDNRQKRQRRVRAKVSGTSARPRLSVFKSNKHIYAQIIDDQTGKTVAAAYDGEIKGGADKSGFVKVGVAQAVGELVAKKAIEKKIKQVVFDRAGNRYTGRIKAVADGARQGGLEF
jgi:large subunit ribosomal protein L18